MKLFLGFYETDKSENALVAIGPLPEGIWGSAEEQGFKTLDQIQRLKPGSLEDVLEVTQLVSGKAQSRS